MDPANHNATAKGATHALALIAIVLIATAAAGLMDTLEGSPDATAAKPFDPPSMLEQEQAAETARIDPRVETRLSDHHVHLGTSLRTGKHPDLPIADHPRLFDVRFYDYSDDTVVWAIVDPTEDRVTGLVHVDFPYQPPLAAPELERARELALTLDTVTKRFPGTAPPITAMLVSGEGTECPQNRCLLLAFVEKEATHTQLAILVNLSQDRILRVIEGLQEVQGS